MNLAFAASPESGTDAGSPSSVMIRLDAMQDAARAAGDNATIATIISIASLIIL